MVRLLRDHRDVVLVAEATDRYRVHRGTWGTPRGASVDVRLPAPAAARAVRMLRAADPAGTVRIHTDDTHVLWRTDRVQVAAATAGRGPYPDLERARELAAADTAVYTVARDALLATIDLVRRLSAPRHARVWLTPYPHGVLGIALTSPTGGPIYQQSLTLDTVSGEAGPVTFNPVYVRDAVTFLDGPVIAVHAGADRLPVYLSGARRHAVVWQLAA
jgi:DNA polymerase III sliding clamp (beta) subunit (PCNA family)